MKKRNTKKVLRFVWFSLVFLFLIWNWSTFQSRKLPEQTFSDSEAVAVMETDDRITFRPTHLNSQLEVIFFQGGLTDPKAYGPLCRSLAKSGFTTHIIKMDWRLPQYDYKKTIGLFELQQGHFVIGGHSQGAKMAAQLVYENPKLFKGLFLMGTSHPRDIDLSEIAIPCIKLYAENDGLASIAEEMANKDKLPPDTQLVLIEGGNHSQFGYLGQLFMDNAATISLKEQQKLSGKALLEFLTMLSNRTPE